MENTRSGRVAEQIRKDLVFSLVTLKLRECEGKGILYEIFQLQIAGAKQFVILAPQVSHFINGLEQHSKVKMILC